MNYLYAFLTMLTIPAYLGWIYLWMRLSYYELWGMIPALAPVFILVFFMIAFAFE